MITEEEREAKAKKKTYRQRYYNNLKNSNPTVAQKYSRDWWIRNKDTWLAKSKLAIKNPVDTFNLESSYQVSFECKEDSKDDVDFLELFSKKKVSKIERLRALTPSIPQQTLQEENDDS